MYVFTPPVCVDEVLSPKTYVRVYIRMSVYACMGVNVSMHVWTHVNVRMYAERMGYLLTRVPPRADVRSFVWGLLCLVPRV